MHRLVTLVLLLGSLSTVACNSSPKDRLIGRWAAASAAPEGTRFANTVGMMDKGTTEFTEDGTIKTTSPHGTYFAHFTVLDAQTLEIEERGMEVNGKKTDYEAGKGGSIKVKMSFTDDKLTLTPEKAMTGLPQAITLKRVK